MPRSRGSEVSQRQSPRVPLHLKTTVCSEANGVVRHSVDRSPKVDVDRRSPRGPLHETKKRGTRVADLETKLTQTQEELKKLKEQLASSEAAKRDAQQELEETKKLIPAAEKEEESVDPKEETTTTGENIDQLPEPVPVPAEESINSTATDVFEVVPSSLIQTASIETDDADVSKEDGEEAVEKEVETKTMIEEQEVLQLPKSNVAYISDLNDQLAKKEKEVEALATENEGLKKEAEEAKEEAAASRAKEEETSVKLVKVEEELRESKKKTAILEEQVDAAEGAKETLEAEMKRLRVQTEQWRKAAEAAAAVLSAGEDGNGGGAGFVGSRGMGGREAEEDGKRRGGVGMRVFGELWKKKGQK